jgi:copper chaperone CopZ
MVLGVTGMACSGCANTVSKALSRVPGVTAVDVDLASGRAEVAGRVHVDALVAAVEKAGFEARIEAHP